MGNTITGETCRYQIRCVGLGIGLPGLGIAGAPASFDDGEQCSTCASFQGLGYMGGASLTSGVGWKFGGGIKRPNGPMIANPYASQDEGSISIGVSHDICYFRHLN